MDWYFPNQKRRFVFGCLKNKDYEKMMKLLFKEDDEIYLNEFEYPNAASYNELRKKCPFPAKKYTSEDILGNDKLNQ